MLITEMKSRETLDALVSGKVFVLNCHGCREIRFPEHEADAFQAELSAEGVVTGIFTTEYICSSKIPLVNLIRLGKNAVRGMK